MRESFSYSLLPHNTFGIEARCARFVEYNSVDELRTVLPTLHGRPFLHIGEGSNLLFTRDYDGTILHSAIRGRELTEAGATVLLRVGAGENWDELVEWCVAQGLCGLENLSLIPGEVGAAAVQNIGAYGVEVGQLIENVETVEVSSGRAVTFSQAECTYAYRSSIFKTTHKGQYIVTHVTLRLSRYFAPDLSYGAIRRELEARGMTDSVTPAALRQLIVEVRRAKLPDPKETGSAGSFFMNPVVTTDTFQRLLALYPEMPHYALADGVKIPAGWLIEQSGWKGRSLGRAGVYAKQALVLVNLGGATGADIVALAQAVSTSVREKFGVEITPEVNYI